MHLRLRIQNRRVFERLVADLVEGIVGVLNELAEEDLLIGVEGIDDQRKDLVDVRREGVAICVGTLLTVTRQDVDQTGEIVELNHAMITPALLFFIRICFM